LWFRQILYIEFLFGMLKDWTSVWKDAFSAYLIRTFFFHSQVRNITLSLQWSKKLIWYCGQVKCVKRGLIVLKFIWRNLLIMSRGCVWLRTWLQWIPLRSHQLNTNHRNSSVVVNISVASYLSVRPSVCLPVYMEQTRLPQDGFFVKSVGWGFFKNSLRKFKFD
jgi:hypothetical protein